MKHLLQLGGVAVLTMAVVQFVLLASHPAPASARGIWARQFGSPSHNAATSVAVGAAGDAYVAGWTSGALPGHVFAGGPRDAFIRKYNADGSVAWTRQFGTPKADTIMGVASDTAGTAFVVGQTGGSLPGQVLTGQSDAFVRSYSADGAERWTRQFGSSGETAAVSVAVDADGSVYVAGYSGGALASQTSAGGFDAFVRKYAPDGTEVWTREFGTAGHDRATRVALDSTGGVYVLGRFEAPSDTYLRKYAADGSLAWSRMLGTPDGEFVDAMTVDASGNVYVGGRTGGDEGEGFFRKYFADGATAWTREIGRPASPIPLSMVTDVVIDASNVYVAGHIGGALPGEGQTATGGFQAFVLGYNPAWPQARLLTAQFMTAQNVLAAQLAENAAGDVYLVGSTAGSLPGQTLSGPSDAFIIKVR